MTILVVAFVLSVCLNVALFFVIHGLLKANTDLHTELEAKHGR